MADAPRELSATGRVVPLARLGVGGMGEVLLARRTGALGFEKLVALKLIRADHAAKPAIRAMFADEARILARLDHPAIAHIYELGEQDGVLFFTMEYVAGVSFGAYLSRKKAPFPPGVACRLVAAAARAAHAAHELCDHGGEPLGVVHRDLTPQNLMLTFDGRVKVLDFGVAWMREREADTTDTGAIKGKLAYLAPEQIAGRPVDRRADVYALSIVLHEMLTARRLFGGASLAASMRRPKVVPPSSRAPGVSAELDALVMRGLERDVSLRWPTALALAEALEAEAARVGAESTEAFAERALTEERAEHRAFVERVTRAPEALALDAPLVEGTAVDSGSAATRRRRWPWALVALAAAVVPGVAEVRARWSPAAPAEPALVAPRHPVEGAVVTTTVSATVGAALVAPATVSPGAATSTGALAAVTSTLVAATTSSTATAAEQILTVREEPDDELPAPPPPAPPAAADAGPSARPQAAARTDPRAAARLDPRASALGTLTVVARPGGTIYVDGRPAGATPLLRHHLRPGRHVIALRRPGDVRPRWQAQVNTRQGRHLRIELR